MPNSNLQILLRVIPVIVMWTFANVLIASVLAGVTFIQLVAVLGWSKSISLCVAILVAIAVNAYIMLQPKIRNYMVRSK